MKYDGKNSVPGKDREQSSTVIDVPTADYLCFKLNHYYFCECFMTYF